MAAMFGMIERRQDLRLAPETRQPIGVERKRFGQDLQRDVAIQLRITRAIDFAHSSRANGGVDYVRAESRSNE